MFVRTKQQNDDLAETLERIYRPTLAITVAVENKATRDDLVQVVEYAFELFARSHKAHVAWFGAGDDQKLRAVRCNSKNGYYHFHAACRVLNEAHDNGEIFLSSERYRLEQAFSKSSKRSKKKFYKRLQNKTESKTDLAANLNKAAPLQYDLRINLDVKRYTKNENSTFSQYILNHSGDFYVGKTLKSQSLMDAIEDDKCSLIFGIGCPRAKRACNKIEGTKVFCSKTQAWKVVDKRRVCELTRAGKLLPALANKNNK
jgi:hypothetical protein